MSSDFTHLHLHTQYSLLDGAIRIGDLVTKAKEYKMDAVAITDHGVMYGAVDFYTSLTKAGIKPILGMEAYVANGDYTKRERGTRHLVLLAKNATGYANLMKLASESQMRGFYYHPRIDRNLLRKHAEGLIGLSACLGGVINRELMHGTEDSAAALAKEYAEIFDEGHFFLEIQPNGMEKQIEHNEKLIKLAKRTRIPLVATGDCHYMTQPESKAHDILMCIQTGKTVDDPNRMKHETDQLYFKSAEEMVSYFDQIPEAIENTRRITDMVQFEMELGHTHLPNYPIPEGQTYESYLSRIAHQGLEARLARIGAGADRDLYRARLEEELKIIIDMKFPGYFLIVWDFIKFAKENGVAVGPGRGSGAGSLVAYSLGITDLDPIPYNLLFERFLNPERVSMPDFDIDFCMHRREEVIQYVTQRYGADRVAQIATFGSMKARAVVRDVGRALGMSYGEVDALAKMIPDQLGMTLKDAMQLEPKIGQARKQDKRVDDLFEAAKTLEGLNRHAGTHAAGVVIAEKPLWEHVPVFKGKGGEIVTQFAKDEVEAAGLVKFDFLGLKTLTVIETAVRLVNDASGSDEAKLDINEIPLDDPEVYRYISSGETDGVFQLESGPFKKLIKKLKPDCFEDIIALVALYRPGPLESGMVDDFIKRKHGQQEIDYLHPLLEEVLQETYGVIVYQEQVMRISQILAGYTLGGADLLRRAMGKKKPEEMKKQKDIFLMGASKNKIDPNVAERIFDLMEKFAGYGFNKSHSAAYALISYQTAWLKRYHPVQFMAAIMTCEKEASIDHLAKYIHSAKSMGIEVLPPDVNSGEMDFSVDDGKIRFGLSGIKNVKSGPVLEILRTREEEGKFESLLGFCKKVDLSKANRKVLESLIRCGAFDSIHANRAALWESLEETLKIASSHQKDKAAGQSSLFEVMGGGGEEGDGVGEIRLPNIADWPERDRLQGEKELLGLYVSAHPLEKHEERTAECSNISCGALGEAADESRVFLAGMIDSPSVRMTKAGKKMASAALEDLTGRVEIVVFPKTFASCENLLTSPDPVQVVGRVKREDEGVRLLVQHIVSLEEAQPIKEKDREVKRVTPPPPPAPNEIHFAVDSTRLADPAVLNHFKKFLTQHAGAARAVLHVRIPGVSEAVLTLGNDLSIDPASLGGEEAASLLREMGIETRDAA